MGYLTFLNGDQMPILGLGTFRSEPGAVYDAVRNAIKIGYRLIDCAKFYGNEKEIGQALHDAMAEGDVTRDEIWVTSKLWNNAHQPDIVKSTLQSTIDDLKLEFLDLYLMHWPVLIKPDVWFPKTADDFLKPEEIPLCDTWKALEECVNEGLTKHIGISNFTINKINNILDCAVIKPEVNQVEIQPYLAQQELVAHCHSKHIHVTAYASLGSGFSPKEGENYIALLENPVVRDIAMRRGMTPAQVLLRWTIQRGIAVIPKSVNFSRLTQNFQTLNFELANEDMNALDSLDMNRRFITGGLWCIEGSPYSPEFLWED